MQNLFQFFARFGTVILFVILELFCFVLIIRYNQSQKEIFINSSGFYSGFVLENYNRLKRFYKLSDIADSTAADNARLRADLRFATIDASFKKDSVIDTAFQVKYSFISAEVVGNTINQIDNYITVNKGSAQGIKPGMGVINEAGIVGVVRNTTKNYSVVLSILSAQSKISAAIKRNGYFGSLSWDNHSTQYVRLRDVPKHADVNKGDTIITSGYSSIFPKGILIGTVEDKYLESGSSFYDLKVKLFNDIAKLGYTYIIVDSAREQLDSLNQYIVNQNG